VIAPLEVDSDCLCQFEEFNHVNPTLAAFQCHHVGRCRRLCLRERGPLPLSNSKSRNASCRGDRKTITIRLR
jgi:hypothetical protein